MLVLIVTLIFNTFFVTKFKFQYRNDAKKLLQEALLYKNYDLESRLIVTIQKEQKKLNW